MSIADEILKRGYVDVKVRVSGLRQQHRLEVVMEKTSSGTVPFLVSKYYIPTMELVRLAEELQLPVKHKDTVVFPKGKMAGSFAQTANFKEVKKNEVIANAESDTVDFEIEN